MYSFVLETWGIVFTSKTDTISLWLNDSRVVNRCLSTGQVTTIFGARFTVIDTMLIVQIRRADRWESLYMFRVPSESMYALCRSFVHINVQKKPSWSPS